MVKKFDEFLNEGWNPLEIIKNIFSKNKPGEISHKDLKKIIGKEVKRKMAEKEVKNKIDPNASFNLTFEFRLGLLRVENLDNLREAFKKMALQYNLTGEITNIGGHFYFDLKGKHKDTETFYEKLKDIIYNK